MAAHSQNRRRQLVVNKPLQGRLVLSMALFPAIALAVIAIVTGVWCTRIMDDAMTADAELPDMMPLFYLVIGFELLAGGFLAFTSLKVSHRIAGPAYRLCKSLERIRTGDLAFTVKLRLGDHLTEVADELNRTLDWLNANPPAGCITRSTAAAAAAAAPPPAPAAPGATADTAPEPATTATPQN